MKKLLFIFTLAATLFFGCSKDDEEVVTPESLDGTSWVFEDEFMADNGEVALTQTFEFKKTTYQWIVSVSIDGNSSWHKIDGTYTYKLPSITVNHIDTTYTGTVNLNTMNLFNETYIRK